MPNVTWICFHGLFDFAYLLHLLSNEPYLPTEEFAFQSALELYFPNAFDIKTMAEPWAHLQGSLRHLSQELKIERLGTQHQAGSDSLITAGAFFKLKEDYYNKKESLESVKNQLFGLVSKCMWEDYYVKECEWYGGEWIEAYGY